jgi:putative endonuclease
VNGRLRGRRPSVSERLAGWWLVVHGYRVLGHRVRTPAAEVDLVCRRGRTLVVVEVKRRVHGGRGAAAEAIGRVQAGRLVAAAGWLHARSSWAVDVRIDLLAIDGVRIRHLRDAVNGGETLAGPTAARWPSAVP